MMENKIDLYRVYRRGVNVPNRRTDPVHMVNDAEWGDIDWSGYMPDERRSARAELAADIHWLYLTHLTILGDIIAEEPDVPKKRLATVLVDDRMRNVDAWSKYLSQLDTTMEISNEMVQHAEDLLSDEPISQLVSIIFGQVFIATLEANLIVDKSVFQQLISRDVKQDKTNVRPALTYFSEWQKSFSQHQQKKVVNRINRCLSWTEVYLSRYEQLMKDAGIDSDQFITDFRANADWFRDLLTGETVQDQ